MLDQDTDPSTVGARDCHLEPGLLACIAIRVLTGDGQLLPKEQFCAWPAALRARFDLMPDHSCVLICCLGEDCDFGDMA